MGLKIKKNIFYNVLVAFELLLEKYFLFVDELFELGRKYIFYFSINFMNSFDLDSI